MIEVSLQTLQIACVNALGTEFSAPLTVTRATDVTVDLLPSCRVVVRRRVVVSSRAGGRTALKVTTPRSVVWLRKVVDA